MQPQSKRITKKLFETIMKNGTVIQGDVVYIRTTPSLDMVRRFSTVVPKKIAKKAHNRNRIKRRINAVISDKKDMFPVGHYIFFAKTPEIKSMKHAGLEKEIENLIQKL